MTLPERRVLPQSLPGELAGSVLVFDLDAIDQLYAAGVRCGTGLSFGICDKRMLLTLQTQLPEAVARECAETVTVAQLEEFAAKGWYPLLPLTYDEGLGAPLYAPSRIGMFLVLLRRGFTDAELRVAAESEESLVDYVFADDELTYHDDDIDTLVSYTEARIDSLSNGTRTVGGVVVDDSVELEAERDHLQVLLKLRTAEPRPGWVHKAAFRVRAVNDCMRTMLLDQHRAQLTSGYSYAVTGSKSSQTLADGKHVVEIDDIAWGSTIRTTLAQFEGDATPPIRVPGFLLRGEAIVSTQTMRPDEYAQAWHRHNLDKYLIAWRDAAGQRTCLHCVTPLPADAHPTKRFCNDRCRNAAKQRRFRKQNPDAAERARERYWQSVREPDTNDGYKP